VTALGVNEIAWARGHTYLTLVYDIGSETKRLLAEAEDRSAASLRCCLDSLGKSVCLGLKYVCSDMWKPYLNVIADKLVTRKSYGFRTAKVAELALLHNLGQLPEPESAHRLC
jgi:hypothetical protein